MTKILFEKHLIVNWKLLENDLETSEGSHLPPVYSASQGQAGLFPVLKRPGYRGSLVVPPGMTTHLAYPSYFLQQYGYREPSELSHPCGAGYPKFHLYLYLSTLPGLIYYIEVRFLPQFTKGSISLRYTWLNLRSIALAFRVERMAGQNVVEWKSVKL